MSPLWDTHTIHTLPEVLVESGVSRIFLGVSTLWDTYTTHTLPYVECEFRIVSIFTGGPLRRDINTHTL